MDGRWGEQISTIVYNRNAPRIFYFVALDCEHQLHKKDRTMPRIEIELEIMGQVGNQSYDHFSYEERGMLSLHVFLFVIFCGLFGFSIYSYMTHETTYASS